MLSGKNSCLLAASLLLALSSLIMAECLPCTETAQAALKMGQAQATEDYWQAIGACLNMPVATAKAQCRLDAEEELQEALELLKLQDASRLKICQLLGQGAYAPNVSPSRFIDFRPIVTGQRSLTPNRYFPLKPGTVWEYIGFDEEGEQNEIIEVEVLRQTKEILGIHCIVVHDRVWELEEDEPILVEDTFDWYAQDIYGTVWYFGELSQEFEDGELVSLEGSWEAGRDGAKPGIIMKATPRAGNVYRQEFLIGEAEDVAKVVGRNQVIVNVPFGRFTSDVLQTREWTPLEPEVYEYKFYAPTVGLVLEQNPVTGEKVVLLEKTIK